MLSINNILKENVTMDISNCHFKLKQAVVVMKDEQNQRVRQVNPAWMDM